MAGISYGISVKTVKGPNDFIAAITKTFSSLAILIFMLLMISQFIATINVGSTLTLQTGPMLALTVAISTVPLAFVTIVPARQDNGGHIHADEEQKRPVVRMGGNECKRRFLAHDDKHRIVTPILRERDHLIRERSTIQGNLLHSLVDVTRILHLKLIG